MSASAKCVPDQTGESATRPVPKRTPINLASSFNWVHWVRRRYSLLAPNEPFTLPSWEINSTFASLFVAQSMCLCYGKKYCRFLLKMYGSCCVVMHVYGAWCRRRVWRQVKENLKLSDKSLVILKFFTMLARLKRHQVHLPLAPQTSPEVSICRLP